MTRKSTLYIMQKCTHTNGLKPMLTVSELALPMARPRRHDDLRVEGSRTASTWVALCPIRTEPESTARCVPNAPQRAASTIKASRLVPIATDT